MIIRGEAGVTAGVDLVPATERVPSHVRSVLGCPFLEKNGLRSFVELLDVGWCLERRHKQPQRAMSQRPTSFYFLQSPITT